MAVRPSVVIGLGTTGSSITTAIYNRFKEFCEQTGEHLESIQFINIDTAEAVAGADDLKMKGRYISIALPQAEAALQASLEFDRFMKQWWPKSYTQIGNLVDGAGTVPIHGRFAFWQGIGPGGAAEEQFLPLFNRSMVEVSKYAPDRVGQPDVYIFSTLCGGTGAGCFLDVAHMIRNDTDYGDCK
ncbi:MAG TPA: tubulin-like doman-containing protein, partial [Anaerolineales bacterium]|nr:tubulin-like doman-containing protein [Anaerolineales bacterium]